MSNVDTSFYNTNSQSGLQNLLGLMQGIRQQQLFQGQRSANQALLSADPNSPTYASDVQQNLQNAGPNAALGAPEALASARQLQMMQQQWKLTQAQTGVTSAEEGMRQNDYLGQETAALAQQPDLSRATILKRISDETAPGMPLAGRTDLVKHVQDTLPPTDDPGVLKSYLMKNFATTQAAQQAWTPFLSQPGAYSDGAYVRYRELNNFLPNAGQDIPNIPQVQQLTSPGERASQVSGPLNAQNQSTVTTNAQAMQNAGTNPLTALPNAPGPAPGTPSAQSKLQLGQADRFNAQAQGYTQAAQDALTTRQYLEEAQALRPGVYTGGLAEFRQSLAKLYQGLGGGEAGASAIAGGGMVNGVKVDDAYSNSLALNKILVPLATSAIRNTLGTGRITNNEFNVGQQNWVNLETDPNAVSKMFAVMDTMAGFQQAKPTAFARWARENPGKDPGEFESAYDGAVLKRLKNMHPDWYTPPQSQSQTQFAPAGAANGQ